MSKQPNRMIMFQVIFMAIALATYGCGGSSSSSSSVDADANADTADITPPSDIQAEQDVSPDSTTVPEKEVQGTDGKETMECSPGDAHYCAGSKVMGCNSQRKKETIADCAEQGETCSKGLCKPLIPTCVQPHIIETRSDLPESGNLVAVVSVDDCENEPVLNLKSEDFALKIDGATKGADISILERTPEYFITLVLDSLALDQDSNIKSQVVEGTFTFVNELMAADTQDIVAISIAFLGTELKVAVDHTMDPSAVKSAITQYFTLTETSNETPLAEEIGAVLDQIQQSRNNRHDLTAGGALTLGFVLLFSDGSYQKDSAELDKIYSAVAEKNTQILTVQLLSEEETSALNEVGENGNFIITNPDELPETFALAAARINALADRAYTLGICPLATKGKHDLSITVLNGAGTTESLEFLGVESPQCPSNLFEEACDDFSCGGAFCGACADAAPCMEAHRCPCEGLICGNEHGVSCGSCGEMEACASDQKSCVVICIDTTCGIEQTGHVKISSKQEGLATSLSNYGEFGGALAGIPDINGDGVEEFVVGADYDDDGAANAGAIWMLMMNPGGSVQSHSKISATQGGFTGTLIEGDRFGSAVTSPGDLDGDGIAEVIVGANLDDDGGPNRGAVWVLFLLGDGTVKKSQKISSTAGNFTGDLDDNDEFGSAIVSLGDLDGDGTPDIFVGAINDDDGGTDKGAVWLIFLNADGTAKGHQKISALSEDFAGGLESHDKLGSSLANLGDINEDGIPDLGVGMPMDDHGDHLDSGAIWILFMENDGKVKSHQKITTNEGGFLGSLESFDNFGSALLGLTDLDGNGTPDLVVGSIHDDDGGLDRGAIWILFLKSDGGVTSHQKISATKSKFGGTLKDGDKFGSSFANLNNSFGSSILSLGVGAPGDDDGGKSRGAVWGLSMVLCGVCGNNEYCSEDLSTCVDACGVKTCGYGEKSILCGICVEPQQCTEDQSECQCTDPLFEGKNCDVCKDPLFTGTSCSTCINPNANISTGCLTCISESFLPKDCCGYCGTKKECIDELCTPIKEDDSCFFAKDGICDTFQNCPPGTDCTDCGGTNCQCTPQCQQKECGPDGCGGECGEGCDDGFACIASNVTAATTCILETTECGDVPEASCDGFCTGADPPANCMCDDGCQDFGDCCPDYVSCCLSN